MGSAELVARLRALDLPVFRTADAAGAMGVSNATASRALGRLADAGVVVRLARGCWSFVGPVDPLVAAQTLLSPWPCYVSLYSALFHHGLVEQVPQVTWVVSLAPTRRLSTPIGTFSVHRVAPEFFFGWDELGRHGARLASPEKALLDVLYLAQGRSRLFARLPELTLPRTFSKARARRMVSRVHDPRRRAHVAELLEAHLAA